MPEQLDDQARAPTRVGQRTKGEAVDALVARSDLAARDKARAVERLRADAAGEAFAAGKLPVVARAAGGDTVVEVAVHEIVREGDNAIRLHVEAARDGKPIDGWDVDQRIVCPPLDIVRVDPDLGETIAEDPVMAVLDVLLQHAIARAGAAPGLREQIERIR